MITQDKILHGNKVIAEFMGAYYVNDAPEDYPDGYYMNDIDDIPLLPDEFYFHSSWDWLMPVVEKIEGLGYGVTIYRKGCHINDVGLSSANGFNHSSKIEQTWKACVEFIEWYNKQKDEAKN